MRMFSNKAFDDAFNGVVLSGQWQEETSYYPRYRSRYEAVLRCFCADAADRPLDLLEVGGGQLAALAHRMWGDQCTVADLSPACFAAESGGWLSRELFAGQRRGDGHQRLATGS